MSRSILIFLLLVLTTSILEIVASNILTTRNALFGNQTQYLNIANFYLVMQGDRNLVLYQGNNLASSHQVWHIDIIIMETNCILLMQLDGNLVITMQLVH